MNSKVNIEFFEDAVVLPLTKIVSPRFGGFGQLDGSVHYSNYELCELAATRLPLHDYQPADVEPHLLHLRLGHYVFGGLLHNEHFGHFLTECLARLWAFDHISSRYDTVLFYLLRTNRPVADFIEQVLSALIPNIQLSIISSPTIIQNIAVPQELKIGRYIYGHPYIRSMCERFSRLGERHNEYIYVSRSQLRGGEGAIFGEKMIDQYFLLEGYSIVYPETMTISEQIQTYRGARRIVFSEGSALHLFALVSKPEQRVFVVWRRGKYGIFDWQIQTFGGPRLEGEPCLLKLWVPEAEAPDAAHGMAFLDFRALSRQLFDAGYIKTQEWTGPTEKMMGEEEQRLCQKEDKKYILVDS